MLSAKTLRMYRKIVPPARGSGAATSELSGSALLVREAMRNRLRVPHVTRAVMMQPAW
jgi:hypothetical protein